MFDTMFAKGHRFWVAGMALEKKFKVKKCITMWYLIEVPIFVMPSPLPIDSYPSSFFSSDLC